VIDFKKMQGENLKLKNTDLEAFNCAVFPL